MPDCLFCKIAAHVIPVQAIHEDNLSIAFPDINPQAPTHWLLIPKLHTANAEQADEQTLGHLLKIAAELATKHLPNGHRIVINTGRDGGQTVHHLHFHLLGGRSLSWPPG